MSYRPASNLIWHSNLANISWSADIRNLRRDSFVFPIRQRSKAILKPHAVFRHYIHWVDKYRSRYYTTMNINVTDAIIYHFATYRFKGNASDVEESFKANLLSITSTK